MTTDLRDLPVFICGHPKSGTSLLRGILDSHPELVTYPEETGFFRRYLPKAQGQPLDEKLALSDQFLTHIFDWNRENPPPNQAGFPDRDYSNISAQAIRDTQRRLVRERLDHDGDILSAAVLAYGEVVGKLTPRLRWWVEKTPYNERFVSQIFSFWPQARCVHMVRDPRDNYSSYVRKHPDWTPAGFAGSWRTSTLAGLRNEKTFGSDRYLIIRYEDFALQPEATISRLCAFLGIQDSDAMRQPTRDGRPWQGNSMFPDQFNGISAAPVGRWHELVSPTDCFVIETLCAAPMSSLHYEHSKKNARHIPISLRLRTYKTLIMTTLKENSR